MRTTTERRLLRFTTRTIEPKGRVGWQAVIAFMSNRSPLAVCRPLKTPPYQEARPWSAWADAVSASFRGASTSGVALAAGSAGDSVAAGRGSGVSACTVRVETATTPAASATEETPATSQIRSGDFEFALLDSRRFTTCPFY